VHFVDAWVELSGPDLARLLIPLVLLVVSAFFPGLKVGRVTALGVAASIPLLREMSASAWLTAGWVALWVMLAVWRPGDLDETPAHKPLVKSGGVLESGTVGLALGLVLGLLLMTAVARQDMSLEETRRASYGAALLMLGLLHLMLRRHIRRAMAGFAAAGLGLQVLDGAAQEAQLQPVPASGAALLFATWLTVVLTLRVAAARERYAGTAWVSDAHDLHD
jgi:hypothetical protein